MKNLYRYKVSPTLKLMESAMKRNVLQKINEVGHQKDYLSITVEITVTVKNGSYATLFLFLTSLGVLMDTYGKYTGNFPYYQSHAPVI